MSSKQYFFLDACTKLYLFPIYDKLKRRPNKAEDKELRFSVLLYSNNAEALHGYLLPIVSSAIQPNLHLDICVCGASEGLLSAEQCDHLADYNIHVTCTSAPPVKQFDCVYCDPELASQASAVDDHIEFIGQTQRLPAELARLTLNMDYCYEIQRSHTANLKELREKFRTDPYSTESSILAALHIKTKLLACGISPEPIQEAARQYYEMLIDPHQPDLIGSIAALEHQRWCVCQWLNGWRAMTSADLETVFDIGSATMIDSTKDKTKLWHAALVPCGVPMRRPLSEYEQEQWDTPNPEAEAKLDDLDRQSLAFHRHAKAQRQKHLICARALLQELKPLVDRDPQMLIDSLIDQLDKAPNTFLTANTKTTFDSIQQTLEAQNSGKALEKLQILKRCTHSMLEYAEFRDLKIGDFAIAELLPVVLLFGLEYKTLIKTLSLKAEENALPLLILNPQTTFFLVPDNMPKRISDPLLKSLRAFAAAHTLHTEITAIHVSDHSPKAWTEAIAQASANDPAPLFDVTGAGASFMRAIAGQPSIIVRDGKLLRYEGASSSCEAFNALNRQLLCTDAMQLANRRHTPGWAISNWAEVQSEITGLFEAYLRTEDDAFTNFSAALAKNAQFVNDKEKKANNIFSPSLTPLQADSPINLTTTCREQVADASHLDAVYTALSDYGIIEVTRRIVENRQVTYTLVPMVQLEDAQLRQLALYAEEACSETPYIIERTSKNELRIRRIYNKFKLEPKVHQEHEAAFTAFSAYITGPDASGFYTYKNNAVRQVLLKAGNILEDYLYRQLCLSGLFTDVQLGHTFQSTNGMIENEIDCIAIAGGRDAIFFSCKSGKKWLENAGPFVEIARHRDTLGIGRAKAVLVTSSSEKLLKANKLDVPNGELYKKIREELDVHIIDRSILREPATLRARLKEIINSEPTH